MIYTLTLNPALDVSGTVIQLTPNEKNYVTHEIRTPGGNGINAGIIAQRLGASVIATGFLGGANGKEIELLLEKEGMKQQFVPIAGRTRMNLTVADIKTHQQTRLSFPGAKIALRELKQLNSIFKNVTEGDLVVIGGSLPPNVTAQFITKLLRFLHKKKVKTLVDIPGKVLAPVISERPYFIKPNLVEFQELMGKKVRTIKAILPLVRELNKKVPLICVSSVEGGAILVNENEAWYGKIPRVKIRSSVGAGDSMVGAMAYLLTHNPQASLEELLREGLAASCATLTEKGMILGSKKSINHYRKLIHIVKI